MSVKPFIAFFVLTAVVMSAGCKPHGNDNARNRVVIGVSYQNLQNEFIINIQDAMRARAKQLGVELIEADGQGKAENQIAQVENFLSRGVDAIILNPYDKEGSARALDLAAQARKPIVVVNAIVSNLQKADAYVGSEDAEAGRIAATRIAEVLRGRGNIAILHGPAGHSAELQRTDGEHEALAKYPNLKIEVEQSGNWDRAEAMNVMENWIASGRKIDAVIAQNDEMALGACKAIEAAGKQKEIAVIGIDAIADALKAVESGQMTGTVFQDAKGQGALAVELAADLARGKKVKHDNYIPFRLVTKENLASFR